MGRISRGYAIAAMVFGSIELIAGIALIISAVVLAGKIASSFSVEGSGSLTTFTGISYWWGGAPFILPGILGMVTFCTRNSTVALCHLIFNILSFFAALGCTIIGAALLVIWSAVVNFYHRGNCVTLDGQCTCILDDYVVNVGGTCQAIESLNGLFLALTIIAAFGTIVILIACYVNCVSLCNQEQMQTPGVIMVPAGHMVYQNQPGYNPSMQQGQADGYNNDAMHMHQTPPPVYNQSDKARLVVDEP